MKLKLDGTLYPMPEKPAAFGDMLECRRQFDWTPETEDTIAIICTTAFMVLREANPKVAAAELIKQVKQATQLEQVNDDGSPVTDEEIQREADPTPEPSEPASDLESDSAGDGS